MTTYTTVTCLLDPSGETETIDNNSCILWWPFNFQYFLQQMMGISAYYFCQKTLYCMVYCITCVVHHCQNESKLNHQGNLFAPQLVWFHCLQWNHFPVREMVSRVLRHSADCLACTFCKFLQLEVIPLQPICEIKNIFPSLGRRGCHRKSAVGHLQPFGQSLTFLWKKGKRLRQEPVSYAARYEFSQINPRHTITLVINTCTETILHQLKTEMPTCQSEFAYLSYSTSIPQDQTGGTGRLLVHVSIMQR